MKLMLTLRKVVVTVILVASFAPASQGEGPKNDVLPPDLQCIRKSRDPGLVEISFRQPVGYAWEDPDTQEIKHLTVLTVQYRPISVKHLEFQDLQGQVLDTAKVLEGIALEPTPVLVAYRQFGDRPSPGTPPNFDSRYLGMFKESTLVVILPVPTSRPDSPPHQRTKEASVLEPGRSR